MKKTLSIMFAGLVIAAMTGCTANVQNPKVEPRRLHGFLRLTRADLRRVPRAPVRFQSRMLEQARLPVLLRARRRVPDLVREAELPLPVNVERFGR